MTILKTIPCKTCLVFSCCKNDPKFVKGINTLIINRLIDDCQYYKEWYCEEIMRSTTIQIIELTCEVFGYNRYSHYGWRRIIQRK